MKKYIVLSVNENQDYLFFLPLTCWAWRKFGWEPVVFYVDGNGRGEHTDLVHSFIDELVVMPSGKIYKSATVAQVVRLFAAVSYDGLIMTGDADMCPLSDYWNPDIKEKTVYGYDLTGYKEFPICYIAMSGDNWREVMDLYSERYHYQVEQHLNKMPNAKSDDFYKWWGVDQQLITERLKPYNPVQILRGQYANGLAVGRVDRANWSLSHSQLIDAHLFHQLHHRNNQDKFEKVIELLYHVWPKENFDWFIRYYLDYQKLTGHA